MEDISPAQSRRAIRVALASHPGVEPRLLAELAGDESWRVRKEVASNPGCPIDLLVVLSGDEHAQVRGRVAARPSLPSTALGALAADSSPRVRAAVATHPATPPAALAALAEDAIAAVRLLVARHRATPTPALALLSEDRDGEVRLAIARNPSTPSLALAKMVSTTPTANGVNETSEELRLTVAANPSLSPGALQSLFRDYFHDRSWARVLAANPSTPPGALGKLAGHQAWDVQRAAAGNPSTPPARMRRLANSPWLSIQATVAATSTDPTALLQAFNNGSSLVRFAVAGNPHAPEEVLSRIGAWSHPRFSRAEQWTFGRATANPSLPADLVERLLDTEALPPWVRRNLALHPNCSPTQRDATLSWLALGGAGPGSPTFDPVDCLSNPDDAGELTGAFVERQIGAETDVACTHPLWPVRARALGSANTLSTELLEQLNRDERAEVRRMAARFRTSDSELRLLAEDADPLVRRQAEATLQTPAPPEPAAKRGHPWAGLVAVVIIAVVGLIKNGTNATSDPAEDPYRDLVTVAEMNNFAQTPKPVYLLRGVRIGGGSVTLLDNSSGLSGSSMIVSLAAGPDLLVIRAVTVRQGDNQPVSCGNPVGLVVAPGQTHSITCPISDRADWEIEVAVVERGASEPATITMGPG